MTEPSSLATVERDLLSRFPIRTADPLRVGEFEATFGACVAEVADIVVVAIGTLPEANLSAFAERLAEMLTTAIETAAAEVGVNGSPWICAAKRWAMEALFVRVREVSVALAAGGRA